MPDSPAVRSGSSRPGAVPSPDPRAALLWQGGARDVLARIVEGDPLGLRALVRAELRRRALLADADAVHLRALARVARDAPAWRGRPPLDPWLRERVRETVQEQWGAAHSHGPDPSEHGARSEREREPDGSAARGAFVELAARLGFDPGALGNGLARFHALTPLDREAFFVAILEGRGLDEATRRLGASYPEVARALRRVLTAFLRIDGDSRPVAHAPSNGSAPSPSDLSP